MIWGAAASWYREIPQLTQEIGSLDQHTGVIGDHMLSSSHLRLSQEPNQPNCINQRATQCVAFMKL